MSLISYGVYEFPEPLPFVAIDDSPIYVAGEMDHFLQKITLVGNITGSSLLALATAKREMTLALTNSFEELIIESNSYPYAKPIGVSFDDSNLTTLLPYSVEFEVYSDSDFSEFFGIKDPVDTWTYAQQQGRIVKATHSVSAVGVKVGADDGLTQARSFVSSRMSSQFENIGIFNEGSSAFLTSKTEEIDNAKNSYGITEEYTFSTSSNPISDNGVVTATVQLSYSKEGSLQASVAGTIVGSMLGSPSVEIEDITTEIATELVRNAVQRSKSNFEEQVYGPVLNGPTSLNYDVNEVANTISFSFEFKDPTDEEATNILHKSKVTVSASKDSNLITVDVNGSISYRSAFDLLDTNNFDLDYRYGVVNDFFQSLDFYAMALEGFADFCAEIDLYEDSPYLNPINEAENINKDPLATTIDYSYKFSNNEDLSNGQLNNLTVSITDELPIEIITLQESVNGFAQQTAMNKKLGSISIQGSSNDVESELPTLKTVLKEIIKSKTCEIIGTSTSQGDSNISSTINAVYSR